MTSSPVGRVRATIQRHKKLAVAGAVVAAFATGAVVAALLTLRADITGSGVINAPTDVTFSAATVTAENGVDCVVSTTGGAVNLDMNNGTVGGFCVVDFALNTTGAPHPTTLVVDDLRYATVVEERILNSGCGTPITAAGSSITARFTLSSTLGAFTAQPDAGLYITDTPTGLCPAG